MGKRSNFKRNPKDFYKTRLSAVVPLIPHLPKNVRYVSPCYGSGEIERHLMELLPSAVCVERVDLYASHYDNKYRVFTEDARTCGNYKEADMFIENPPWMRQERKELPEKDGHYGFKPANEQPLHMVIDNLAGQKPTWLLFDSDWAYTVQAAPYLKYCVKIVAVGRVSWMGNGVSGMDNASWYLFDKNFTGDTVFIGREK